MLRVIQLGVVSSDLPGTLRLYSEAFGFRNAGSTCLWGEMPEKITNLRSDARTLIWWMVGSETQKLFQLELFNYTCPVSQPVSPEWRPCDRGWSRFGVQVANFDLCLKALKASGVDPMTPAVTRDGRRRVAIRDPFMGKVIEVIESDPNNPDGPVVLYATNSVGDIEEARKLYGEVLQFEILPLDQLHLPEDEALWGLPGARREGFLARLDDFIVEVVEYRDPVSKPMPAGAQVSDQGIMNIALGDVLPQEVEATLERLTAAGHVPPFIYNDGNTIAAYTFHKDCVLEYGCLQEEYKSVCGFVASPYALMGSSAELNDQGL